MIDNHTGQQSNRLGLDQSMANAAQKQVSEKPQANTIKANRLVELLNGEVI